MTTPEEPKPAGLLAELVHPEGRLLPRVLGVFRLDPNTYSEIAKDPGSIPQAFAVVIATSVLVGLGSGSMAGIFIGVAWSIVVWLVVAALVWGAGALVVGERSEYAPLLRCLGFAYAWFSLFIGYELPLVGFLFGWGAVSLCLVSNVLAVRQVMRVTTEESAALCALALGLPLVVLWLLF